MGLIKLLVGFFFPKQKFTEQIQAKNTPGLSQVLASREWLDLVMVWEGNSANLLRG